MTANSVPHHGVSLARLAPELHHMIYEAVDVSDVPNLRLACKSLAAVGSEYLLPEVELLFTPESFNRLRRISEHPVLSRRVKSLVYRIDSLKTCHNISEWWEQIPRAAYLGFCSSSPFGPKPTDDDSYLQWRDWISEQPFLSLDPSYQRLLRHKWEKHQLLWTKQEYLRQSNFGQAQLMTIVANLPDLKHIVVTKRDFSETLPEPNPYRLFEDVLGDPIGEYHHGHSAAVPQILTILRCIDHCKLPIRTLSLGLAEWHLFHNEDFVELGKQNLGSLVTLRMRMVSANDLDLCRRGLLPDFFRSLPSLQILNIQFDVFASVGEPITEFQAVIGTGVWSRLHTISLDYFLTSQKNLVDLFKRHARSLKVVILMDMYLLDGTWPNVWKATRDVLNLTDFILTALTFYSGSPPHTIPDCECGMNYAKVQNYVLRVPGTEVYTSKDLCRHHG
ncbi:MAG: hypothetical protein Q9205_005784 [Flavoplaca limonia]